MRRRVLQLWCASGRDRAPIPASTPSATRERHGHHHVNFPSPPLHQHHATHPKGWNEVLTHMSPYGWGYYGIGLGLGCSVVGAAWGIWLTGSALTGAAVKAPRIRSKNLIRSVTQLRVNPSSPRRGRPDTLTRTRTDTSLIHMY